MSNLPPTAFKRSVQSNGPQLRSYFADVTPLSPGSFGLLSPRLCYDSTPSVLLYPSSIGLRKSAPFSNGLWDALGSLRSPTAFTSASRLQDDFGSFSPHMGRDYPLSVVPRTPLAQTPRKRQFPSPISPRVASPNWRTQRQSWYYLSLAGDDDDFLSVNDLISRKGDETVRGLESPRLNRILEEQGMTLMLRNVPNKYTREMLLDEIREHGLLLDIDFFYVPIDMRQQRNVGYCFVNVTSADGCKRFRDAFDGAKLGRVETGKVCVVDIGKVQGLEANINAYRNAAVMSMSERYQPLLLDKGVVRPFPPPTLTRAQLRNLKPAKKGVSKRREGQKHKEDMTSNSSGRYIRSNNSGRGGW